MATIVRLTYTENGKSSLVNLDNMKASYRIFEKSKQRPATRINFATNDFIIVDEKIQRIMELAQDQTKGIYQSTNWNEKDPTEESNKTIKQKLVSDFKNNTAHRNIPTYNNY